jgi:hypothetical protein
MSMGVNGASPYEVSCVMLVLYRLEYSPFIYIFKNIVLIKGL